MLYLGIDLHTRQLTICLRDEAGNILQRRQVGTHPEKLKPWFDELQAAANTQGGILANFFRRNNIKPGDRYRVNVD